MHPEKIKIFLVEDHPIFRRGLAQLITSDPLMEICGEAEEYIQALNSIRKIKPDFVIVDITLKEGSGIDLIKDVKLHFPKMPILALSMHDENIYAERILRAGARGYLMKQEAPETIIKAIRNIMQGKVYLSEAMSSKMLNQIVDGRDESSLAPVEILSNRELEIFGLLGRGLGTREIAQKLHVSVKTVENHRAHIKEKLNLKNSIELIQRATLWVQMD